MAESADINGGRRGNPWRIAIWGSAAFLLLLPAVAMQFTSAVNWDGIDFITFGIMLAVACGTYELAARMTGNSAYRAAVGVAVAAAFLLVWVNLAVGIIGSENNPLNLIFGGVIAVGILGSIIARFHPRGMQRAMVLTATVQVSVGIAALILGWGSTQPPGPLGILILNGFFAAIWLFSAWLFAKAARGQVASGTP